MHANQLPTPTLYYTHECQNSLIQCSTSTFLCQFQFLEFMNKSYGSTNIGTFHQHFQYVDISRGLGDRVRLNVNNGERPGISTARLFLPHDQIMTFDFDADCHVNGKLRGLRS